MPPEDDSPGDIPAWAGIGLRDPHMAAFLAGPQPVAGVEVHSENYLCDGGPRLATLERVRESCSVSCHGVGLSLASADGLDRAHLAALRRLFDRVEPVLVSEHLAWSVSGGRYWADLLPIPYTHAALARVADNVDFAQQCLGRRLLIENPTPYVAFAESVLGEAEFMARLAEKTGCGVLLDLNNLYVTCRNHGLDPAAWMESLAPGAVGEYHLAGHGRKTVEGRTLLIDSHAAPVSDAVWSLYEQALARFGPRPTFVEWDLRLPPFATLLAEAEEAERRIRCRLEHDRAA